jgi:hypothetical protein
MRDERIGIPAPGGEPLWRRCSTTRRIRTQRLMRPRNMLNRRLPRTTQRNARPQRVSIGSEIAARAAKRWVIPGSRLLTHPSDAHATKQISPVLRAHAKAAPLQAQCVCHATDLLKHISSQLPQSLRKAGTKRIRASPSNQQSERNEELGQSVLHSAFGYLKSMGQVH